VDRRRYVGVVSEIRIITRELGNPPHSPVLRAVFEFTLASGEIIESTEDFGPEGIINEELTALLMDLRRVAGLES
jgi:hypothetical protein